jgi:hypothetical protein
VVIWYIFTILVCLDQEKSGNPGRFSSHVVVHQARQKGPAAEISGKERAKAGPQVCNT